MKTLTEKIQKTIESYPQSAIPDSLLQIDKMYNDFMTSGKIKQREPQLYPNEAFCSINNNMEQLAKY